MGNTSSTVDQLLKNTVIINNVDDCAHMVDNIMSEYGSEAIAFDCEWTGKFEEITMLQISAADGRNYIIDLLTCSNPKSMLLNGRINELLSSTRIIKVVHDCRMDRRILREYLGITLRKVFDTQIAYSVLQHQKTGTPVKQIKLIGLNELYQLYGAPTNPYKDSYKSKYKYNQRFWATRPLTKDMLAYAAFDVQWLLHVYRAISIDLTFDMKQLVWNLSDPQGIPTSMIPSSEKFNNELQVNQPLGFFATIKAIAVLIILLYVWNLLI